MAHPVVFFEVLGGDGDALRSFYGKLFEWEIEKVPGPMDYGMVSAGSAALWGGIAAVPIGWSPHVTFYVQTGDIAATIARASEFGGRTLQSPMRLPSGSTIALIQDPEGHTIGLTQPAS